MMIANAPPTKESKMKIGFFFWPFNVEMTETMARHADTYGYDMIGIADTAGNAMDPWLPAARFLASARAIAERKILALANRPSRRWRSRSPSHGDFCARRRSRWTTARRRC